MNIPELAALIKRDSAAILNPQAIDCTAQAMIESGDLDPPLPRRLATLGKAIIDADTGLSVGMFDEREIALEMAARWNTCEVFARKPR